MEIKKFIANHKKEIIIGGVVITGVAATILAIKLGKGKVPTVDTSKVMEQAMKAMPNFMKNDLAKPTWDHFEVIEHWFEGGANNMIITGYAPWMGELGEHLINDPLTWANPDIPIEMVITYGSM